MKMQYMKSNVLVIKLYDGAVLYLLKRVSSILLFFVPQQEMVIPLIDSVVIQWHQ